MGKVYKRPESVLVVVYDTVGQVLLLRRRDPKGYWQSVTGSLEWGESSAAAAARELFEETGIATGFVEDCCHARWFTIYRRFLHRYRPGVTRNLEHVFRVRVSARHTVRLDSREHEAWCWVSRTEAVALASSHTNRDAILKYVPAILKEGGGK